MRFIVSVSLLLLITSNSHGQKYALLDRGWKRDVQFVDTVIKSQINSGWYPIYANQLDSLIEIVNKFTTVFKKGLKRQYFNMTEYQTSSIEFNISNVEMAYGDRYDIDMTSTTDVAKVTLKLSNPSLYNRENQQKIKAFHNYLINAKRKKS